MLKDYREDKIMDIDEMKERIMDELSECDNDREFDCANCCDLEECFSKASIKSEHEFAESINYGGYDSEEEFWDELLS